MKRKWFFVLALLMQLPLMAQDDTITNSSPDTVPAVADRRGHYIEAHIGAGYGSLGYNLTDPYCKTTGSLCGIVQLQYAYFFHRNCGIGFGAWFTNYSTTARLGGDFIWKNDMNGNPLYDSDKEPYWHNAHVLRWREREIIHNVGIPVSLQFQHLNENRKAGVFAAFGAAPALSVFNRYRIMEGEIKHDGYYPAWNLLLENVHEFQTKDYTNVPEAQGDVRTKLQVDVFADFGLLVSIGKQTEMLIGAYFNMSVMDANASDKQALGWKDADYPFMNEYKGAYATTLASVSRPWEAGLKLGIHWHALKREKKAKKAVAPAQEPEPAVEPEPEPELVVAAAADMMPEFETLQMAIAEEEPEPVDEPEPVSVHVFEAVPEAVVLPEPVAEPEPAPIKVAPKKEAPKRADKALKLGKVFFLLDNYELSDEAVTCLQSIVPVLKNDMPDCTVILEGHASEDGSPSNNLWLSIQRAKVVADYLAAHGIDAKRFRITGLGSQYPNEENDKGYRYLDRRVEIKAEPANEN